MPSLELRVGADLLTVDWQQETDGMIAVRLSVGGAPLLITYVETKTFTTDFGTDTESESAPRTVDVLRVPACLMDEEPTIEPRDAGGWRVDWLHVRHGGDMHNTAVYVHTSLNLVLQPGRYVGATLEENIDASN